MCAEDIRAEAVICHYCMTEIHNKGKDKEGRFVNVKLGVGDVIYRGEIFIPGHDKRVSDVLNDRRLFISMIDTVEEMKGRDYNYKIGYIALSKKVVEWVRIVESVPEKKESAAQTRTVYVE